MKRAVMLLIGIALPAAATGQSSVYGTRGLGFPGRPVGVRALALGGGAAMFDPGSAMNPALAAGYRQLTVGTSTATTFRDYTAGNLDVTGLQDTRFPFVFIGAGIGRSAFSYAVTLSTYTDRSFGLATTDTIVSLGLDIPVSDTLRSDGGIVDVRGAIGWAVHPRLSIGAAVHRLAGSTRVSATRTFGAGGLSRFEQEDALSFSGGGLSAGLYWRAQSRVRLTLAARTNAGLNSRTGDGGTRKVSLPSSIAGGVLVTFAPGIEWSTSTQWTGWSTSADDFLDSGTRAFDTWEVGTGLELGANGRFPLRFGLRRAQLPFSHNDDQPTEWNYSVGTGTPFAANRASIDFALERFQRDGANASEQGWYLAVGITITPSR